MHGSEEEEDRTAGTTGKERRRTVRGNEEWTDINGHRVPIIQCAYVNILVCGQIQSNLLQSLPSRRRFQIFVLLLPTAWQRHMTTPPIPWID